LEKPEARGEIFNVGSGMPITIKEVAEIISDKINPKLKPIYNEHFRVGDIRHCLADISKIKLKLGYKPKVNFKDGIDELLQWIKPEVERIPNNSQKAFNELEKRGLLK
jgi:dTDP-L-rhamnose 4-epimerase